MSTAYARPVSKSIGRHCNLVYNQLRYFTARSISSSLSLSVVVRAAVSTINRSFKEIYLAAFRRIIVIAMHQPRRHVVSTLKSIRPPGSAKKMNGNDDGIGKEKAAASEDIDESVALKAEVSLTVSTRPRSSSNIGLKMPGGRSPKDRQKKAASPADSRSSSERQLRTSKKNAPSNQPAHDDVMTKEEESAANGSALLGKRSGSVPEAGGAGVAVIDGANYVKRIRKLSANASGLTSKLNEPTYHAPKTVKDPWCDPENPRSIQFQDISAAAYKIRDGVLNTPCTRSNLLSLMMGMEIYFKKEFLQVTGSFKERGARYTLSCLSPEQQQKGVIAASAGNHALALAYHGQQMGIPVTVVMPVVAPLMKISLCRQYGANILVKGEDIGESKELALKMAEEHGYVYINGYDHPHILAGQGTMGLEIVEAVENVDAVIIPIGGGGLIAGAGLAIKYLYPNVKIIGVEAEKCPSFSKAMEAGHPIYTKCGSTISDGLSVPVVGCNSFETVKVHKLIDKVVTVSEEFLALAILRLIEMEKAVVEGAGAIGLAALLSGALPELKGKRVVIPLTGGNIDTTILGRAIERALAEDGRLIRFVVVVSDRPGGIAEMASLLAHLGASVKDIYHERAWLKNDIFNVRVKVTAETRDKEHAKEVEEAFNAHYSEVVFNPII